MVKNMDIVSTLAEHRLVAIIRGVDDASAEVSVVTPALPGSYRP
jgi:hypothetical protein